MEIMPNSSINGGEKRNDYYCSPSALRTILHYPCPPRNSDEICKMGIDNVEIKGWRRARNEDIPAINELIDISTSKPKELYNKPRIDHLIEKSFFPIVQLNSSGKVVSFTSYVCHPNVPSVPPFCWVEWIQEKYNFPAANSMNSLFIHFMVWHPRQKKECIRLLLETPFLEFSHVRYLILIKPPFAEIPEDYREYFIPVLPSGNNSRNTISLQSLNVCERDFLVEHLKIRKAMAEDSDVLMCLFRSKNNYLLEKTYGEFFFADLIEFSEPYRQLLICEYEGEAAGVMSINLSADLNMLNDEYELGPFKKLIKPSELDSGSTFSIFSATSLNAGHGAAEHIHLLPSDDLGLAMNYQQPQGMTSSSSSSESVYELELPTLYVSSLSSLFASPMDTASTFSLPPSTFEGIESFNRKADMRYRLVNEPQQQHHHHHHHHHDTDRRSLYSDPKASNAIYIELFEMDTEKIDERLSVDFLKAAFSLAPDREYCVITIPTDMYPFPLLNYFVKANHNHRKQLRHELYICHRSYIFNSSVLVRPAVSADGEELKQFLSYVVNGAKIFAEFKDTITPPVTEERCYCLIVNETIVGAAMLFRRPDLENLEFYFDIKEFTFVDIHGTENTSILKHLLISPPFQCFSRYFMMEVMRLADVTCLFHLSCQETRLSGNILAVLGELIPIKPRRTIKNRKNLEASKDIFSSLLNFESPFSLFMANFEVCSHVKLDLNRIIVVVGASLTAYSFFESVIFRSSRGFTLYNNLIWISEDAVELAPNEIRSSMFPLESKYTSDYCKMLSLRSHVHCIYGVMTGINRSDKYIIINESHAVKYDILILTVGLQFQRPTPVYKAKMENCKRDKFIGSPYARFLKVGAPVEPENKFVDICNMFIVNNQLDAESLLATLDRVKQRIQSGVAKEKRVIIYGYNIRVFLMIHALLKFGIPPNMIAYFEPFPSRQASMSVFGDTAIDSQVIHIIENIGVQYYPKYFFYDWTLTSPHHIGSISFHSENRQITVPCLAFLPMVEKLVSDVNFHACNKAGLVYDGRLIIDKDFQTNDEHIFAAGPFTKYSRRYYAPGRNHQFYNSVEIGEKLAELVQMEIDPYFYKEKENECETMEDGCDDEDDLPTFKEPIMLYCQLPGDFYYFSVRKPGKEMEIETDYHFGNFGDVLSTGDCQMSRGYGYFKVHLDESGYVRNIVCFDNKEIDYARLYTLYGKHEKLLNNLLLRYDCSMVTNFYEYFREPWTDILSNPDFRFLYKYNRKIFYEEKMKNNKESMMDRIDNYLEQNEWKQLPSIQRRKIELLFQNSDLKSAIKKNLFELLEYLKKELPGFSPSAIVANVIDRSAGMEGLNHPGGFS